MVFINEKKFACQTCIKGHRSSGCQHTERPLFEIKKKGRPVTQCEHCRELRKTRQVHVKCQCDTKEDSLSLASTNGKKSGRSLSATPAFPTGLPPVSEPLTDTFAIPPACGCQSHDECKCWSRRAPAHEHQVRQQVSLPSIPSASLLSSVPTLAIEKTNAALSGAPDFRTTAPSTSEANENIYQMSTAGAGPSGLQSPIEISYDGLQRQEPQTPSTPGMFDTQIASSPPPVSYASYNGGSMDGQQHWQQYESPYPSMNQQQEDYYSHQQQQHWPPAALPSSAPFSGQQCGCGASCSCPGCAEHGTYDGASRAASQFCTAGCTSGHGPCANSVNAISHAAMYDHNHTYAPTIDSSTENASIASFNTFSSITTTTSSSAQSQSHGRTNSGGYQASWMSSPEPHPLSPDDTRSITHSRRTSLSFATSGERGGVELSSPVLRSPYSLSASSSYQQLPQQPHLHHLHSAASLPTHFPQSFTARNRSVLSLPTPQRTSKSSAVKRSFKRLLPRPIAEVNDGLLVTSTGDSVYPDPLPSEGPTHQEVVTLARAPAFMPFNRSM